MWPAFVDLQLNYHSMNGRRIYCFLLPLFILSLNSFAQRYDPSKINKKALALYEQARERAEAGNYINATAFLQQAIAADSGYADAYLGLGRLQLEYKNYRIAVTNFEKAISIDSNYCINYFYSYSVCLAGTGEFEKALNAISLLLKKAPPANGRRLTDALQHQKDYRFAIDHARMETDKNYVFAPQNVGAGVNSIESEYFPTLSIDGKQLVFTRRLNDLNEDFFISEINGKDWLSARPIEGKINTNTSEAAQSISSDGEWMVFTAKDRKDSYGNYDLYFSTHNAFGWTEPVNLGGKVNSDQWDSQPCLSPDKRELYFASRRLGGMGGVDIYVCHLQSNGKWSEPENLGNTINTSGDDQCPFLHADNQTLYFVSNGHQGFGGNDIFVSRRGPNGEWEKPVNLGYPINTIDDEGTLFVAADGKTAYYASDRTDSKGGLDIYSFELREKMRPFRTLWVKGKVFDKKTGAPLPSTVELTDLASKQLISKVSTDADGNYFITLPVGKDYAFSVGRKDYLFFSDNFLMADRSTDSTYTKDIALTPIEVNAKMVLKNIFFETNKFTLKKESQVELDELASLMNENPTLRIEIGGHTDNVGKPADNLALSNNRAKAVIEYLLSKNISAQRLQAKGFGETQPIADNKTEDGKAKNRRTEMRVTSF